MNLKKGCKKIMVKEIMIDCRTLEFNIRGIGFFLKSLLEELSKIDKINKYYLFINKKSNIKLELILNKNFKFIDYNYPIGFSDIFIIPLIVNYIIKPDVVWFPANNCSPFINKKIKVISTIHDIMFFTQTYPFFTKQWLGSMYRKLFTSIAIKRANYINTPTKYNIELISDFFQVEKNRFFYTYESIPQPKYIQDKNFKNKLKITKKYLYTIAGISPNKNLPNIVESFKKFNDKNEYQLVITGTKNYSIDKDIIFTGYISNNTKHTLLENCELFLFLSRDEGFGIPPLEAIYHNCNLLMTDIPIFRELYFDATNFTNKDDTFKIAEDIQKTLNLPFVYDKNKVLKKFNWNDSAKILLWKINE